MSRTARIVLQDCKKAIQKHTKELQGEELRISWVSIMTLLRAVGHVLKDVDSKSSPAMAKAIEIKWGDLLNTKPEPSIFWKFIQQERNMVIKLYKFGISRYLKIDGPHIEGKATRMVCDMVYLRGGKISSTEAQQSSFITSGIFAGRDEKEVAQEALEWWVKYLDEVDQLAQTLI